MPVTIAGTTGTTQPTATCTTNLVLTGSSSGTTTVQAAATASGTITVPALTGTLLTSATPGTIIQTKYTQSGALQTGTTAIPYDDTIPQNTEGTQFFTLSITPTSASNVLLIQAYINIYNTGNVVTLALFQDSTTNALAATSETNYYGQCTPLVYYMTAGTTSATTLKLRAGAGNGSTVTINGNTGARYMGGVMASSFIIQEIAV
jgi:hypothetical protein